MRKSTGIITTAGLVLIMCNSMATNQNAVQKSSSNFITKSNPVVIAITNTITAVKTIIPIADTGEFDISAHYHKQMDDGEYTGYFLPSLVQRFGDADIRYNFCGVMTLLNTMDIIQGYNSMTAVELVNNYFADNSDNISNTGSMSPSRLYWTADKIGYETGLWRMNTIYGKTDFTLLEPVRKSELQQVVDKAEEVFNNNGVAIMHVGIADHDQFSYFHFITVVDMKMNANGSVDMLIVDSMGAEHSGYYGWVNSSDYLTSLRPYNDSRYNPEVFTGIINIYGVIPNR